MFVYARALKGMCHSAILGIVRSWSKALKASLSNYGSPRDARAVGFQPGCRHGNSDGSTAYKARHSRSAVLSHEAELNASTEKHRGKGFGTPSSSVVEVLRAWNTTDKGKLVMRILVAELS